MSYDWTDFRESVLGAFVSVLLFFAIRAGESFNYMNMWIGLGITIAWYYAIWTSFKKVPDGEHFFMNMVVVYGFCALLSVAFGMTTFAQIKANPFGSPAMIASWIAFPVSLLMDKFDISSVLSRYYVRGIDKGIDKVHRNSPKKRRGW